MLASSTHYCHVEDKEELIRAFKREPIVCKLTDFGDNVNRGTPSFMAPEIKVLTNVGADELRRIDMWAYGML